MLPIITGIIISYFLGSIPTAYLFVRAFKGVDIRSIGSGNVGATNASRVLGKGLGGVVLLLDILKGFLAVWMLGGFLIARGVSVPADVLRVLLGLACISGHNWTVFLNFKGGKGIATTLGVLLSLAAGSSGFRMVILLCLLTWIAVFVIRRIVSLASVVAAITLPVYMVLFKVSPVFIFTGILLTLFVLIRHKENIKRLLQGREQCITFGKSKTSA
ncbi:MAG: glycerol-3-phosphate 1-O-acyltransferase PlsY [Candidatus Omnitrophica bacterium]|nr:glycerol-3-phosphate 1-O-acyltransferase PlsY [Candidatus Omnitrophota bacterium]